MTKRFDLPPEKSANFSQRVRETLMTYLGRQGDPLDRGLTMRDLIRVGLLAVKPGASLMPGQDVPPIEPGPAAGPGELDLTPPPTPSGFKVDAGITSIFIEHDVPLYKQGGGHFQTRVYGVTRLLTDPKPTFDKAVEITQFQGTIHAHPSNPSTTWHLWIKWESKAGVLSADPAGGTNGLETRTGEDVALLLEALTGQITEGQLYQDLQTRLDGIEGNAVAIQQESSVRQTETGSLFAKYTVKIDNNGYVTGYGLASTSNNGTPTSEFAVRADRFYIASPSGPGVAPSMPFIVQTTPTTINGVSVPVGVYMNDAYIRNGTITNAKIANAAIDDAKIANLSASKITAGSIAVGQHIQSAVYQSGQTGWRITGDGYAEFANAWIRGTVFASAGEIGGNSLGSNFIQSKNFSSGSAGWRLQSDGYFEVNQAKFRAEIMGRDFTGYFWPPAGKTGFYLGVDANNNGGLLLGNQNNGRYFQVNAEGDVFAPGFEIVGGVLNAYGLKVKSAQIDDASIGTLKLQGNAVTVPVGGSGDGSIPGRSIYMSHPGKVFCIVSANALAGNNTLATMSVRASIGGSQGPEVGISMAAGFSGSATAIHVADVGAGNISVGGSVSITQGSRSIGATGIFAIGVMR